jgi:hypothetical protein
MLSVECHDYLNVMLSVVMLNVVRLNVVRMNVVMMNVIRLSVVASFEQTQNIDKYSRTERKTERAK